MIRLMTIEDYDELYQLWERTPGVGLRMPDDTREGIQRFIHRNPNTNFVSIEDGRLTGSALGGHDGRRGYLYHVCVAPDFRRQSIGKQLVGAVADAMRLEGITRISLVAKVENKLGNHFWNTTGWLFRKDLNFYSFDLNNEK